MQFVQSVPVAEVLATEGNIQVSSVAMLFYVILILVVVVSLSSTAYLI